MNKIIGASIAMIVLSGCSGGESTSGFDRGGEGRSVAKPATQQSPPRVTSKPRWATKTVSISAHIEQARRWTGINFVPGRQITIGADNSGKRRCGNATYRWKNGIIQQCHISINYGLHSQGVCGTMADTIVHEVGHCLGLPHSATGIMASKANSGSMISQQSKAQLNGLYGPTTMARGTTGSKSIE